jgi:thymidylate synthase (FAD)
MIEATYIDHMGSDLSVVNAARVSFGKQSEWEVDYDNNMFTGENVLSERDTKLIKYLAAGMSSKDIEKWREQMITATDSETVMEAYDALKSAQPHMSPFGHAFASFHVKAPIFVARQLVKHKFLRWNEISRRYVDDEPEFYVPDVWRGRSADKKQGSDGVVKDATHIVSEWDEIYRSVSDTDPYHVCLHSYNELLLQGVAPEQARMVLPQSTMTEWYWSGSLDAFAAMCKLRCAPDTQYESRIVADQISEKMGELFPVSWAALMKGEKDE